MTPAGRSGLSGHNDSSSTDGYFTVQDRFNLLAWEEAGAALGTHAILHEFPAVGADGRGEFLSIYRANPKWASWGIARSPSRLRVWSCAAGADFGEYGTLAIALAVVAKMRTVRWQDHGPRRPQRTTATWLPRFIGHP